MQAKVGFAIKAKIQKPILFVIPPYGRSEGQSSKKHTRSLPQVCSAALTLLFRQRVKIIPDIL
jgi:hypothetical protein